MNNTEQTTKQANTVTLDELANYAALATLDESREMNRTDEGSDSPAAKRLYMKEQAAINIITDFFFSGYRGDAMDYIEKHGDPDKVPEQIQDIRKIYLELCS